MKVTLIAGARPNFMKIAPIVHAINVAQKAGEDIQYRLVHTGQHYDDRMSDTFFRDLGIPEPHVNLECGGGTASEQTAAIMVAFERELIANPTDMVIVVGDVTSTMACAIVAKKLNTKVAHVEGGIRSWDQNMPEEINRMVTDSITDYFFTTSKTANRNLSNMGVSEGRIFFVGNVMIDTLLANRLRFKKPKIWDEFGLQPRKYLVLTLHRPANVDQEEILLPLLNEIATHVEGLPVVFPAHPRTAATLEKACFSAGNIHLLEPLGYLEFNFLVKNAKAVITDSGGITEETTVLSVPCITLRDNTERPETVNIGTNELIGTDPAAISPALRTLFEGKWKKGGVPERWDGYAAKRIVETLVSLNLKQG